VAAYVKTENTAQNAATEIYRLKASATYENGTKILLISY